MWGWASWLQTPEPARAGQADDTNESDKGEEGWAGWAVPSCPSTPARQECRLVPRASAFIKRSQKIQVFM